MPGTLDNSLGVIAPATGAIYGAGTGTYAFPSDTVRLAGTGTTESTTATALTVGSFASILVGANSVRIVWSSATAGTVATTSPLLPGGSQSVLPATLGGDHALTSCTPGERRMDIERRPIGVTYGDDCQTQASYALVASPASIVTN